MFLETEHQVSLDDMPVKQPSPLVVSGIIVGTAEANRDV